MMIEKVCSQKAVKFSSYISDHVVYPVDYQLNIFLESHLNYNIKLIQYNHPIARDAEKEELFVIFDIEEEVSKTYEKELDENNA